LFLYLIFVYENYCNKKERIVIKIAYFFIFYFFKDSLLFFQPFGDNVRSYSYLIFSSASLCVHSFVYLGIRNILTYEVHFFLKLNYKEQLKIIYKYLILNLKQRWNRIRCL